MKKNNDNDMTINNNQSGRHRIYQTIILVFLAVFLITVLIGLLISGTSTAIFSSLSESVPLSFSAEEVVDPSTPVNLDYIIDQIKTRDLFSGANHQYSSTNQNPQNSWSRRLEDYLTGNTSGKNIFDLQNPISGSKKVVNQNFLDLADTLWNPAVFIADGANFSYDSIPDPPLAENEVDFARLWGSVIIYKSFGQNEDIYFFAIDENGNKGIIYSISFK